MNQFEYRIYKEVYDLMLQGRKTIEFRLLNEKAKKINKGDIIIFKVLNNEFLNIKVIVTKIHLFNNLNELWLHKEYLMNKKITEEQLINEFNKIFGEENVKKYSVIGIEFKIVN